MGGKGSGRKSATDSLINNIQQQNPIAHGGSTDPIFLPNHSGDHSAGSVRTTPAEDLDLVNKKYVDDAAGGISTTLNDGNILVGNVSNVATSVNPSGDVDVTNAGVFSISSGVIVNADVNASAAIAYSKLGTIPTWNQNTSGSAASLSATLAIGSGGTGQTGQTAAFDALSPTTTKGDVIVSDGSDNIRLAVGTNDQVLTADSAQTGGVKWAAAGGGSSEWTDTGSVLHPSEETVDNVVVGGTTAAGADIILNVDGSAVFNEQGNSTADFRVETDTKSSALHIDYANEVIGMFVDPATAGQAGSLSIGGIPAQTNRYILGVNDNYTNTSGTQTGTILSLNADPSGASTAGTSGIFLEAGTATGNEQNITNNESLVGAKFKINHRGTGTLSQTMTLLINATGVTGSITTHYGLFMDRQNRAGITTTWGLYQSHADDPNYFASTVSIGSTTKGEKLLVEGAIQLDEATDPSSTAGYGKIFVDTDTRLKYLDSSGNLAVQTGVIDANVTAVGNVGGGEDDLMTHNIDVTNHMGVNGDSLTIYASGKDNASMSSTIKAKLGTTTIFTSQEVMMAEWFCTIRICRIGQSDQVAFWTFQDTGGNISTTNGVTALAENLSSDKVFKFTGTGGDGMMNDEVTQEYMQITHNASTL